MQIFIDTNKYLDFYRASDHSLSKLDTLISLLEDKKIEIIVPQQVYYEFLRDKEIVFKQFLQENFKDIKVPGILKDQKEAIEKINKSVNKVKEKYKKRFFSPKSKINRTFKKFFGVAKIIPESQTITQAAYYRTLKGNPPRKSNRSFGDAVIWETLLQEFSNKDTVIISGDGDWSSELDEKIINPFLAYEWHLKSKKKIELDTNLGSFINRITQKPKIEKEVIEEEKILDSSSRVRMPFDSGINSLIVGNSVSSVMAGNFVDYINRSKVCSCCGESFISDTSPYSVLGNRCDECSDILSRGNDCEKCGKHFHEGGNLIRIGINYNSNNSNLCFECRNSSDFSNLHVSDT